MDLQAPASDKIAFLIQAHADPEHLARLAGKLRPHDIFVHWDKKSGRPPQITGSQMIEERVAVFWAGFSQVEATIALIRAALSSGNHYSKLVLLSGACYPIRPVAELAALFESDGGHNYLNAIRISDADYLVKKAERYIWRDAVLPSSMPRRQQIKQMERYLRATINLALRPLPRRHPPLELFHGSQWWALTPEAADHALKIFDTRSDLRRFFSFTFASDEKFFQTVLRNSVFSESCGPITPFIGRGTFRTANLHLIDPSLEKWFDDGDISLIARSDKFFVRKVRSATSSELLDWLDRSRLCTEAERLT